MSTPTSATGISTDAARERRRRRRALLARPRSSRGFTLLELLVVVTIIGLFAGAAVLSMDLVDDERGLEREVTRLQSLLSLVREEAVMQSRDFGVLFAEDGYRFYTYDYEQRRWVEPPGDNLLVHHELPEPLQVDLEIEDRDLVLEPMSSSMSTRDDSSGDDSGDDSDAEDEGPQPQVMILASGEITPFTAAFYRDPAGGRFTMTADFDGTFTVSKDGFDSP
ncbi:MAG TPA: type II secretion system minor pseudopilin GspH [Gammaproteobacteria bacterium]